jgi:hypothetical protein
VILLLNRHDHSGLGSLVPTPERATGAKPDRLQLQQAVEPPEAQPVEQPEEQPVQQPEERPVEQAAQQPLEHEYGGR